MNAELVEAVKAIAEREGRTFTAQLERFVRDALTQSQLRLDDFKVDLENRKVIHVPSGVEVGFYDYHNEEDWQAADTASIRNPSLYKGHIGQLAAMAKRAAIEGGMTYCRPHKRRK